MIDVFAVKVFVPCDAYVFSDEIAFVDNEEEA